MFSTTTKCGRFHGFSVVEVFSMSNIAPECMLSKPRVTFGSLVGDICNEYLAAACVSIKEKGSSLKPGWPRGGT